MGGREQEDTAGPSKLEGCIYTKRPNIPVCARAHKPSSAVGQGKCLLRGFPFPSVPWALWDKQASLLLHAALLCGWMKANALTGMHQTCCVLRIYQKKAWKRFVPSFAFWKGEGFGQFKYPELFFWTPGFPGKTLSACQPPLPREVRGCRGNRCVHESPAAKKRQGCGALPSPHSHTGSPAGSPGGHKLMFKASRNGEKAREFSED